MSNPLARYDHDTQTDAAADTDAPKSRLAGRVLIALLVLVGLGLAGRFWSGGSQPSATQATPPLPQVTVSTPLRRKIATLTSFTGQFSAVDRVEIRAQVGGYLTDIAFKDGQIVTTGDLLFQIDRRPYEIALQQAKAQLATATSALDLSNKQLSRTSELKRSDFASGETMDQRTQQQLGAVAAVDLAKAAVHSAELNLTYSRITAPQNGRISQHRVSIGNLVTGGNLGAATTLLTTIVSVDPIYLDFDMSETDYLAYQRYLHAPRDGQTVNKTVDISLSDETGWPHRGVLDFLDNEMDRSSGTMHARVTVPNADLLIAPGQFARLRLPTSDNAEVSLVPDLAISSDQSRKLLMVVAPDGTVLPKQVEVGALDGDLRVIKSGINPDDRVIIDGLMYARPGTKVAPKAGTIVAQPDQG